MIDTDDTGLPRPGTVIVSYQGPPLPATEEEATAADEHQRQVLHEAYRIIWKAAARARRAGVEAPGEG
jgi:hypothetical protein